MIIYRDLHFIAILFITIFLRERDMHVIIMAMFFKIKILSFGLFIRLSLMIAISAIFVDWRMPLWVDIPRRVIIVIWIIIAYFWWFRVSVPHSYSFIVFLLMISFLGKFVMMMLIEIRCDFWVVLLLLIIR